MAEEIIGRVASIARYPVQSLRGEPLAAAMIGDAGLWGDRAWGIFDPAEGKVVTAARGKKPWRDLVGWQARFRREPDAADDMPPAEIELPDGDKIPSDAADADERIATAIGAPARLVRKTAANQPYQHSPVHLLTSATLAALARHYPAGRFEAPRFRPNILVDCGEAVGFIEQGWHERVVAIGEVRLGFEEDTERCVMTTLPQGELPQDPGILKAVSEANRRFAGINLKVLRPGRFRLGDAVRLAPAD